MNVLAIGAHFDDIELGCGGALAKHVANGDNVYAYVATKSGFTNHQNIVIRSDDIANKEGENAMKILGVKLIKGNFDALKIEFNDDLNLDIIKIIEDKKIDLVYSHWMGDIHHDHQAVARASLHSCRHVPRQLMYRSNWYHSNLEFKGNFYVDISYFWEIKKKSIEAHQSEMERTGKKWIEFFHNEAKNAGQRIAVKYAEVFEVVKWLN
ncbi:PIG-L deacetylase family protein [Aliarcobacter butzleri]|uniref:PIG-L deacetylase family protein n=1 Tax=Aliarcobacter butzleri TaxID=28197 RepID=UPI001EDA30AA|nr:PIG-L deacetylase family protein [Aliarcobacter butzleri]MCG3675159.1 PIG-L family deacetylase [Aliarcobacter butzleri]MCG3683703.1 PIG-L family deacetylase [Aliarcobacter butzleri]MCG3697866.1 PIG-L family deacetylase [Aliarcobacter butzleri]MCG3699894.1 PIG-L family deacetylase [Aliarcobacter butzleri]MCT7620083.1 PIG-L family deacetylase [Aliarcobacter butzleri]